MNGNNLNNKLVEQIQCQLQIVQLNVQSITNKIEKIEVFLESACPDIISVSEHWCHKDNVDLMIPNGCKLAANYCGVNYIHGGSSIYIKSDRISQVKEVQMERYSSERHIECCAIKLDSDEIKCCVISVYRPPDGAYGIFFSNLSDALNYCSKVSNILFVCGDININYMSNNIHKKLLMDLIENYNLKCTSIKPTRLFKNKLGNTSESVIDYIFTNLDDSEYSTIVMQPNVADHLALIIKCNLNVSKEHKCKL